MTKINKTLAQRCKSILGVIVAGMLLFGGATQAQTISLTFIGKDTANNYVQFDSVIITNLTKNWQETIYWPDTMLIMQDNTSIVEESLTSTVTLMQNSPNPFKGMTEVKLLLPENGIVSMEIIDVSGRIISTMQTKSLNAGSHKFNVNLSNSGVYVMTARQNGKISSIKMVCEGGFTNSIDYVGQESTQTSVLKFRKSTITFSYGDMMKYVGYATINGTVLESQHINQSQTISETIILQFGKKQTSLPTLSTTSVRDITDTTAISGGNITTDGGAIVTVRGVCWSTTPNPTISDNHTTDSSGIGSFTSILTGLINNTIYYVRAYATNSVGTAYGNEISFTTLAATSLPTLSTTSVRDITDTTAISGGNITTDGGAIVTARGVCWSTTPNPTISDNHTTDSSGIGSFTSNLTALYPNTTYYVRAYATNSVGTAYGNEIMFTTNDTIMPLFSVSDSTKVYFSPGNLQWSATGGGNTATTHTVAGGGTAAGTWRFAPNQWDIIGVDNQNISSTYSGWIDLFGWGTSGYNGKYPYMTSDNNYDYCDSSNNISGTNYDWGVYNAIYNTKTNTIDIPGVWRTLTIDEWEYLLNTRNTVSGIRYAKATVNGVKGLIIVPDDWNSTIYALNDTNNGRVGYTSNTINAIIWTKMEFAGCVFLPAASVRIRYSLGGGTLLFGRYWTTTYNACAQSFYLSFEPSTLGASYGGASVGKSVRLVKDVK